MTCVMVPVLNAGTMLLLGDRSCSWNVCGEQRALFRKNNTLNTMSEMSTNKKIRHLDNYSSNRLTYYYVMFVFQISAIHSMWTGYNLHIILKTPLLGLWSWKLAISHSPLSGRRNFSLPLFKRWPICVLATSLNSNWSTMQVKNGCLRLKKKERKKLERNEKEKQKNAF